MTSAFTSKSIAILLGGSFAGALFCYLIIVAGLKFRILPKESFRREKGELIPLLGGVGIFSSAAVVNIFVQDIILWRILISAIPLLVVGVWDDLREISPRFKIGAQFAAALIWIALCGPATLVYSQIVGDPVVGLLLTFLFLVTLENAFNFLDGTDGQVGMLSAFVFCAIGLSTSALWPTSIMLTAGIIGFLYFNFPPAKLYLGEVGSSFLGFSAGALATLVTVGESASLTFWGINFIFSLAFCDLILAVVRRVSKGMAPWRPDKEHFHHKLKALGLNKKAVLFVSTFIVGIGCLTGYELIKTSKLNSTTAILSLVSMGTLSFIYFGLLLSVRIWGKRITVFGRQIIEKYLPINKGPIRLDESYKCIIVDLMPYFSEIQGRGITEVDKFAFDFGQWVQGIPELISIRSVGSYSVALIVNPKPAALDQWKNQIKADINQLLLSHQVLRNLSVSPEGLRFYDSLSTGALQRLLDLNEEVTQQGVKRAS